MQSFPRKDFTFYRYIFFLVGKLRDIFLEHILFFAELQGLNLQTGYFSLRQIKAATGNFDPSNKIGEGGFGPVYKVVSHNLNFEHFTPFLK